jgi:hypothetical protein
MSELPTTFDEWVDNFGEWQHKVGFDPAWIGEIFTGEGERFEGSDSELENYQGGFLPTAQDEEYLKELFEQDWIEYRAPTRMIIESGIGQNKA